MKTRANKGNQNSRIWLADQAVPFMFGGRSVQKQGEND